MATSAFLALTFRAAAAFGVLGVVAVPMASAAVAQDAVSALAATLKAAVAQAQSNAANQGFSSTQTCVVADADSGVCPYQDTVAAALTSTIAASGATPEVAAAALASARAGLASAPPATLAAFDAVILQVNSALNPSTAPAASGGAAGGAPVGAPPSAGAGGGGGSDYRPST